MTRNASLMVLALCAVTAGEGDTVLLKNGSSLNADVVGSDSQRLHLRVGSAPRDINIYDVVSISFQATAVTAAAPVANPVAKEVTPLHKDPPPSPGVQNLEGFTIRLNRCNRQGTASILCSFSITNTKADRDVALGNVYIVDSAGVQQQPRAASLGGRGGSAHAVYDTPVTGELEFGGVTPEVTRIAKMSILFASGNTSFEVVYRNIPMPMETPTAAAPSTSAPSRQSGNRVNPPRR